MSLGAYITDTIAGQDASVIVNGESIGLVLGSATGRSEAGTVSGRSMRQTLAEKRMKGLKRARIVNSAR